MSTQEPTTTALMQRILVALDTSAHSQAAMIAAADIAALLQAELAGIFVEDINLLHVAQLSFVKEVRYPLAEAFTFDQAQMEQHWRAQAAQARHELAAVARSKQIRHSFEIVRGTVTTQLLNAAMQADLLALGRLGYSFPRGSQLGSTAKTAVSQAGPSVLLMRAGIDLDQPLLLIYDGSPTAQRALKIAARLAQMNGRLRVLIWTDDDEAVVLYRQEIIAQLQDSEIEISFGRVYPAEQETLFHMLEFTEFGLLVIGTNLPATILQTILEELDLPLLLIR